MTQGRGSSCVCPAIVTFLCQNEVSSTFGHVTRCGHELIEGAQNILWEHQWVWVAGGTVNRSATMQHKCWVVVGVKPCEQFQMNRRKGFFPAAQFGTSIAGKHQWDEVQRWIVALPLVPPAVEEVTADTTCLSLGCHRWLHSPSINVTRLFVDSNFH